MLLNVRFFLRHNSSLVYMVRITYVYIDMAFGFYGFFFLTHIYCLVGCLSMIVWTYAVLGVFYACVLYFCICTCLAQLSMFHIERHSRNMLIIIIVIIIKLGRGHYCVTWDYTQIV